MDFGSLLKFAVENGASDVHIQAGAQPMLRLTGQMRTVEGDTLTQAHVLEFLQGIAPARDQEDLEEAAVAGLDFSYVFSDAARFRCSAYRALGKLGITMRVIRTKIPSVEELNLPAVINDVAMSGRGLTLVTGTTGSGKSTTLAAMLDLINTSRRQKIITIEDPVEYLHSNKKSLVAQLEVGFDTTSFDQALRQALRQDPDIILVGELRDVETLRLALRAADTGHQVFSTVHSSNAPQTIERIIAMFPTTEHKLLLSQLSNSIEAIISQRLLPQVDGKQRLPAVEVLRGGPVTEKFILEGQLEGLADYIEKGELGMQSFDQHLLQLFHADQIAGRDAMSWASKPEAFAMAMRGIHRLGSGRKE
jgi:twitching motility protein PilT